MTPIKKIIIQAAQEGIIIRLAPNGLTIETHGPPFWTAACTRLRPHRAELLRFLRGRTYTLEELIEITGVLP